MGSYTTNYNFYKASPTGELVDVDTQVNQNLLKIDKMLRPLAEYQFTDLNNVSDNFNRDPGYKYYKTYSNSVWAFRPDGTDSPLLHQDANGDVDSWSTSGMSFFAGFEDHPKEESSVAYKYEPADGYVYLRGFVVKSDGTDITRNNHTKIISLPSELWPSNHRYFYTVGGNGSGPNTWRIMIQVDGEVEAIRYGPLTSDEKYVPLSDIRYPIDDGNV